MELKFGRFDASDDLSVQLERAEKIRKYIAQRAHTAVILHEMGHSIGLRHNFVSSADAMNYRPQYWQLRTENGRVTENCSGLSSNGKDCVGPRPGDEKRVRQLVVDVGRYGLRRNHPRLYGAWRL